MSHVISFLWQHKPLQNNTGATFSLCGSISGMEENILYFSQSFLIANEVTMFFVCSIASWVVFFPLLSQRRVPAITTKSDLRRETSRRTIRIICTHYSFALDNIITKAEAPCNCCWQWGLEQRGWDEISTKGVLREKLFRCFKRRWQGVHGGWWTWHPRGTKWHDDQMPLK